MALVQQLPKEQWTSYFDAVSGELRRKRAEVDVSSLEMGHQTIAQWLPLTGITYDARDDLVDVSLSALTHLIRRPTHIEVTEDEAGLRSLAISTADGAVHLLKLKEPLALPARFP